MSVRARRPALANVGGDTVVVAQTCGGTTDVLAVRGNPPQALIAAAPAAGWPPPAPGHGAIARTGAPLSQIIKELGVSKQAAGQLVDTLVMRGYLDRSVDPEDRRRLTITLTERGLAAAMVIRSAVDQVDDGLVARMGPVYVAHARATLAALSESLREAE